jgi:hypothetical protein
MKNLKGLSLEKITFDETRSIFASLEWTCHYYADELSDNTELRIDITESDLRDNFEPDNYYTTFEIFFENCEDSDFRELIDITGQAMLTDIFKDENIDYQIYSTENNDLHDLFNNMRG